MATIKEQMERIYERMALEAIPWNNPALPEALERAVTERRPRPRSVIEFGCGAGNNVIGLARLGFDATGVDVAERAVAIATASARRAGVPCRFVAADVLGALPALTAQYDLAFDWELLHHIFPGDRERYLANVLRLLAPDGTYLSVCFSEDDPQFGGTGKYRTTRIGTVLYFSSEAEIAALLAGRFAIEELKTIDIVGKQGSHRAVSVLARRLHPAGMSPAAMR